MDNPLCQIAVLQERLRSQGEILEAWQDMYLQQKEISQDYKRICQEYKDLMVELSSPKEDYDPLISGF